MANYYGVMAVNKTKDNKDSSSRQACLSASLEDYIEAIYNLSAKNKCARSKDIASLLGVSRASVTGALRSLKDKGYVNYKPYGPIVLTSAGNSAASEVAEKHRVLRSFFVDVLEVEADVAQKAACKAEHALGTEIITRLLCFMNYVKKGNKKGQDIAAEFKKYRNRCMQNIEAVKKKLRQ